MRAHCRPRSAGDEATGFLELTVRDNVAVRVEQACNTLKEAQPMMAPLALMLVIPMMLWFQITRSPNSTLALSL